MERYSGLYLRYIKFVALIHTFRRSTRASRSAALGVRRESGVSGWSGVSSQSMRRVKLAADGSSVTAQGRTFGHSEVAAKETA